MGQHVLLLCLLAATLLVTLGCGSSDTINTQWPNTSHTLRLDDLLEADLAFTSIAPYNVGDTLRLRFDGENRRAYIGHNGSFMMFAAGHILYGSYTYETNGGVTIHESWTIDRSSEPWRASVEVEAQTSSQTLHGTYSSTIYAIPDTSTWAGQWILFASPFNAASAQYTPQVLNGTIYEDGRVFINELTEQNNFFICLLDDGKLRGQFTATLGSATTISYEINIPLPEDRRYIHATLTINNNDDPITAPTDILDMTPSEMLVSLNLPTAGELTADHINPDDKTVNYWSVSQEELNDTALTWTWAASPESTSADLTITGGIPQRHQVAYAERNNRRYIVMSRNRVQTHNGSTVFKEQCVLLPYDADATEMLGTIGVFYGSSYQTDESDVPDRQTGVLRIGSGVPYEDFWFLEALLEAPGGGEG